MTKQPLASRLLKNVLIQKCRIKLFSLSVSLLCALQIHGLRQVCALILPSVNYTNDQIPPPRQVIPHPQAPFTCIILPFR